MPRIMGQGGFDCLWHLGGVMSFERRWKYGSDGARDTPVHQREFLGVSRARRTYESVVANASIALT